MEFESKLPKRVKLEDKMPSRSDWLPKIIYRHNSIA